MTRSSNINLKDLEEIPGVGRVTAQKLRSVGIYSIRQLALYTADELAELIDMEPSRIANILRHARRMVGFKVYSGKGYRSLKTSLPRLTTGVKAIDRLLGGGLEPRAIYEFAGEFGAGKTQLCHQLAVTVQLSRDKGGVGGKAFYLDSEGTFSPERIESIAKRFGMDPDLALENIFSVEAINVDHQIECIRTDVIEAIEEHNVKLIIIDSLISHFRAEYAGRDQLALRQQRLNYFIDWLLRIARVYNVYIVVTNQVLEIPVSWKSDKIPAGGNIVAHGTTHRFMIEVKDKTKRRIRVIDSPKLPYGAEALFEIYEGGLRDV